LIDYNEAIRLDPKDAESFTSRGNANQAKGDLDGALVDLNEAIRLDPKYAAAFQNRGDVQEAKGDFDAAIADYSEAIRINPANGNGYRARGFAHFYAAHYGAAASDLARAVADKPADAYPALWLYLARTRAGDQSAAAELASNARQLTPSDWPYAVVELYLGQRTPEATLAAPTKPDDRCEAQFYIGEWQLLRSDRPAAIESLKTAASTCPKDFVEATDAQAELKRLGQ
jgi:lipoprotein NlpI